MNSLSTKTVILAVIAFLLGIGATLFFQKQPEPEPFEWDKQLLDDIFDDPFFTRSRDPFQEMERLQDQIDKHFDQTSSRFESLFDDWFEVEFGDYPAAAIEMKEDKDHIYYEMDIGEGELTDVNVQVENRVIEINATTQSSEAPGIQSRSEVRQRFPLPDSVDPATVQVTQKDGIVTISLRKKEIG